MKKRGPYKKKFQTPEEKAAHKIAYHQAYYKKNKAIIIERATLWQAQHPKAALAARKRQGEKIKRALKLLKEQEKKS